VVTAELFVIPFEEDGFIVYAPLRRAHSLPTPGS